MWFNFRKSDVIFMDRFKKARRKLKSPFVTILVTFLIIIFTGTLLFMLPVSTNEGQYLSFVDALFLSTSAVCVTGLSPVADVSVVLSGFGRVVLAILIELGGLGFVTIVMTVVALFGFKIGISQRKLIKEALNQNSFSGLVSMVRKIMVTALVIQSIGALINFVAFIQIYPLGEAIGYSIFHAISCFNNAGFDLFGSTSLIEQSNNILLNISTCAMIICGGIGFIVIFDLLEHKKFSKLSLHSKIVLKMTAFLLIFGMVIMKFLDYNNISWLQAFFLSVTARTAGFTTVDLSILSSGTILFLVILMFIGASPSSTGGGVKTTTFYTIFKTIIAFSFGKKTTKSHNRKIAHTQVIKAFVLCVFALVLVIATTIILMGIEGDKFSFIQIFFESFSAFGTVGLSIGVTPLLSILSKLLICILMFVGRLGPITFMSLLNRQTFDGEEEQVKYIEEKIIIG